MKNKYTVMVASLKDSNVTSKDSITTVLQKLEARQDKFHPVELKQLKRFLRSFWDVERKVIDNAFDTLNTQQNIPQDVVTNSPLSVQVKTPTTKYIKVDDVMFLKCVKCGGRLFPHFKFCPFCGIDISFISEEDLEPVIVPDFPSCCDTEKKQIQPTPIYSKKKSLKAKLKHKLRVDALLYDGDDDVDPVKESDLSSHKPQIDLLKEELGIGRS